MTFSGFPKHWIIFYHVYRMIKWLFAWFNSVKTKAMHGIHCKIQLQLTIKDTNNSSVPLASPQTSFGVRLSRIHFCVTNEPQRTSAGRLLWEGHFTTTLGIVVRTFARNPLFILTLTKRLNELIFSSRGWFFLAKWDRCGKCNNWTDKMKSFVHSRR